MIDCFKQAAAISDQILTELLPIIKPGTKEKTIAQKIKELATHYKSPNLAFKTLVASGKRAAEPHALPTNKQLQPGEMVFVDFGVKVNGFCSDITRTFFLGPITKKQKKIYQIVKESQQLAIKKVAAGVNVSEIDKTARNYIKKHNYGKYFIHSTGHGIRKHVHVKPRIHYKETYKLKAGEVISIEPAIYIKNWGGIRIEDMVLLTKTGAEVLTKFEKGIMVLE